MNNVPIDFSVSLMLSYEAAFEATIKEKAEFDDLSESYEDCFVGQLESFEKHSKDMSWMIAPIMAACEAPYEGARATDRGEAEALHRRMEALIIADEKAKGIPPVNMPTDLAMTTEAMVVDYWLYIKNEASQVVYKTSTSEDTLYLVRVKCAGNYENVRIFDEPAAEKMRETGGVVIANARRD